MRTKIVVVCLLSATVSACSTPLPCVFNDTPECEARWRPVMERGGPPVVFIPPPTQAVAPPPPMPHTYYCNAQPAGYNTAITCQ